MFQQVHVYVRGNFFRAKISEFLMTYMHFDRFYYKLHISACHCSCSMCTNTGCPESHSSFSSSWSLTRSRLKSRSFSSAALTNFISFIRRLQFTNIRRHFSHAVSAAELIFSSRRPVGCSDTLFWSLEQDDFLVARTEDKSIFLKYFCTCIGYMYICYLVQPHTFVSGQSNNRLVFFAANLSHWRYVIILTD